MYAVPEIEQGLADAAGSKVTVSFTPHLIPMVGSALSCDIFSCFLSKLTKFYFAIIRVVECNQLFMWKWLKEWELRTCTDNWSSHIRFKLLLMLVTSSIHAITTTLQNCNVWIVYMPTNTKNVSLKMVLNGHSSLLWKMFSSFNSLHHRRVSLTLKALSCLGLWDCGKGYLDS